MAAANNNKTKAKKRKKRAQKYLSLSLTFQILAMRQFVTVVKGDMG